MAKPLQGGIAKAVLNGLKRAKLVKAATLTKVAPGTRTPSSLSGGTNASETAYAALGFVADYTARELDNEIVAVGDRKVCLAGASIASAKIPAIDDKVTIEGATYRVLRVERDPAAAIYTLQVRL